MRRANGSGSVFKIKAKNLRNKWRVRITTGWEVDQSTGKVKQCLKTIGYYPTRAEAEAALVAYKECPYDLNTKDVTFKELYEKWSEEYFKSLNGVSSERSILSAFRYCSTLHNMKMRDIKTYHLEECMKTGFVIPDRGKEKGQKRYASACTQGRMKSMFNLMFDWAYARDVVDRNYARAFGLSKEVKIQQTRDRRKNTPFTQEEIQILWDNVDKVAFCDMVLVGIYSGWRPQELSILQIKDIDLEEDVMYGGLKTDAGRNRCVPIHPLTKCLIVNRYHEAVEMGSEFLFNDIQGQQGIHTGSLSKGFGVLTDRRFYFRGKCFYKIGKQYLKKNEERIVDLQDITCTGFIYQNYLLLRLLSIAGAISGVLAFCTISEGGFASIVISLLIFGVSALIELAYRFFSRAYYEVSFAGGCIAIKASSYGMKAMKKFNKALRMAKDDLLA